MNTASEELRATAILSVGLAPGLTNLLALQAKQTMDQIKSVDIAIMLGLGDSHGKAAIEWTVDSLNSSFRIMDNNRRMTVDSFTEGKKTDFGGDLGQHRAYRFPFSDQQTLPHTLDIGSISTRLCFDSRVVTVLLALMKRLGLARLLRSKRIRNLMVSSMSKLRFGSDRYAVKVDAYGQKGGLDASVHYFLQGTNESKITAITAAAVADAVYCVELPAGVHHVEQLFELSLHEDHVTLKVTGAAGNQASFKMEDVRCWSRHDAHLNKD
ncbi:hypothetical protein D3C73_1092050 [compost metagenome]